VQNFSYGLFGTVVVWNVCFLRKLLFERSSLDLPGSQRSGSIEALEDLSNDIALAARQVCVTSALLSLAKTLQEGLVCWLYCRVAVGIIDDRSHLIHYFFVRIHGLSSQGLGCRPLFKINKGVAS
jgi:hypothetical protein